MKHVLTTATLFALAAGATLVRAEDLVANERDVAQTILNKLLLASAVRGRPQVVTLDFVHDFSTVTAWMKGGCVSGSQAGRKGVLIEPSVVITDGALWAAQNGANAVIPWLLAHEVAHLERRASSSSSQSCEDRVAMYAVSGRSEEIEADKESIMLLSRAGYADAESIAIQGLETACTRTMMGCPRASPDHPGFDERVASMRAVGELERFLAAITAPYVVPGPSGRALLCTKFTVSPHLNGVRDITASAGHCWKSKYRNEKMEPEFQTCGRNGLCYRASSNDRAAPIGLFTEDPLDFVLLFEDGRGLNAPYPKMSETGPVIGQVYYGLGIDEACNRGLSMLEHLGSTDGFLKFRHIGGLPMDEGSSGSPILSASLELVGISSNMLKATGETRATDIRLIAPLLRSILNYRPATEPAPAQN